MSFVAFTTMILGGFWVAMAFFPATKAYSYIGYHSMILGISITGVLILNFVSHKARLFEESIRDNEKVKQLIRSLFKFIISNERNDVIKDHKLEAYRDQRKELVKTALEVENGL